MKIATLDEVKRFIKVEVDENEDDTLIESFIKAGEESLRNQTGKQFDNSSELAKVYIKLFVSDLYENRSATEKSSDKVRFTLENIISQLSICGGY